MTNGVNALKGPGSASGVLFWAFELKSHLFFLFQARKYVTGYSVVQAMLTESSDKVSAQWMIESQPIVWCLEGKLSMKPTTYSSVITQSCSLVRCIQYYRRLTMNGINTYPVYTRVSLYFLESFINQTFHKIMSHQPSVHSSN